MTFKELKQECIKALGYDPKLSADSMGNLSYYMSRIDGAILRAFDRMLVVGALEEECIFLEKVEKEEVKGYNIKSIIKGGFFKCFKSLQGSCSSLLPYAKVNGEYYLNRTKNDSAFVVYYEDIGDPKNDYDNVNLDDRLIRIIPYYVKGELIEEEEPSLATASKNTFEALLAELAPQEDSFNNKINYIYEVFE